MKVAVIGAGSTYTPELVSGLERDRERLDVTELALMDPDADRLAVVGGLVQRMLAAQDSATRVVSTTQRAEALEGADAVLV
nr:6-phospho-beta-glucosidase [Geodermatophilaceae bacterium]